jgi:hypothetical protein
MPIPLLLPTILAVISTVSSIGMLWTKQLIYVLPVTLFLLMVQTVMWISNPSVFVANFITFLILLWYFIILYFNKDSLDVMPKSWYTQNSIISYVAAAHFLFLTVGKFFLQLTWITMATLMVLVTMQYINASHFKTDG